MARDSHTQIPYKHKGETFMYDVVRVAGTESWVARGYLESNPSVKLETEPFPTKDKVEKAFVDKAQKIIRDRHPQSRSQGKKERK